MGDTNFDMTDEELAAMADDTSSDDVEQDAETDVDDHGQEAATDEPVANESEPGEPEAVVDVESEPVETEAEAQQPTQQPQVQDKFGAELD